MKSKAGAYPFHQIEPKWQRYWAKHKVFRASDPGEHGSEKPKIYILDMFPYPSSAGLHVGHPEGYTATDITARYKRMKGFNVLHPMGWDAFGLPAEQYAIETKTHPNRVTKKNVETFKRQIESLGFSYDWDREINTTDPAYYKWTQWIFLKLFEKGLAYEAEVPVNWCPALGTVLANEEVVDGRSERGGHPVERKPMRQWVLRITAYAERLLADLDGLDWPEPIKEMQRNWIGKSVGADVDFKLDGSGEKIRVFTTRPDTLFGATYMVLAPEHPLVEQVTAPSERAAVERYQAASANKSDLQRTDLSKDKTGVFTGAYAINPVNDQKIPIWIADYVLMSYGTGAIMAVPAHDERDYEFAKKFKLPIVEVVSGGSIQESAFTGAGTVVNSETPDGTFTMNGLPSDQAIPKMTAWLEKKKLGQKSIHYRLRDWLFSRQRYWGEPFPIIHAGGKPKALPASALPVKLPQVQSYEPTGSGESPLASIKEWIETKDPESGKPARRESNTMPQWAGSCWYYLRYIDPKNDRELLAPAKEKYWMPVDLYVGGAEHAVLHLLYARFWHKVLYDCGLVSTSEPFMKLVNQGMILGEDNQKMSKSRGNVVNPDDIVCECGADAMRLYEMFMGPLEMVKPWSQKGLEGITRFLGRVWRLAVPDTETPLRPAEDAPSAEAECRILNRTIKKVTDDIEQMKFHTAISALMIFVNDAMKLERRSKAAIETFVLLLSPFAPHLAEELWERLGHSKTLAYEPWPTYDEQYLTEHEVEIAVQVAGKIRARIMIPKGLAEGGLKERVLGEAAVQQWTDGKTIRNFIVVPDRLVNIIV